MEWHTIWLLIMDRVCHMKQYDREVHVMVKSMTGFGRGEYNDGKRNMLVEIKSVNHRYSDISVRMPRRYQFAEDAVRSTIKKHLSRGKIDVQISVEYIAESDIKVELNKPLAEQYLENFKVLKDEYGVQGEVTLELLSGMPEVLKQSSDVEDEDEIRQSIIKATDAAAENLEKMRAVEGEKLAQDLLKRADLIKEMVGEIEVKAADLPGIYKEKLRARIDELMDGAAELPEDRLAQEVAIFADKADITEEITRLKSHMDQMKSIINESKGADGKKLDFLVQEMNREANTIGSKANDLGITEVMLRIKSEVEKIREQVQNIE